MGVEWKVKESLKQFFVLFECVGLSVFKSLKYILHVEFLSASRSSEVELYWLCILHISEREYREYPDKVWDGKHETKCTVKLLMVQV